MRGWDLSGGAARLEQALKSLQASSAEIAQSWSDETHRHFVETYLDPLEPKVKNVVDAIGRLAEILANAQRACREPGE